AEELLGAEGLLVEVDRLGGVADDQIGDRADAGGLRLPGRGLPGRRALGDGLLDDLLDCCLLPHRLPGRCFLCCLAGFLASARLGSRLACHELSPPWLRFAARAAPVRVPSHPGAVSCRLDITSYQGLHRSPNRANEPVPARAGASKRPQLTGGPAAGRYRALIPEKADGGVWSVTPSGRKVRNYRDKTLMQKKDPT